MKRREFLATTAKSAAVMSLFATPIGCSTRVGPGRGAKNWAWVHGGADLPASEWRRRLAQVRAAGIHGVLVSGHDEVVRDLADAAHAEDVKCHRWIWVLNRSGDEWVKTNHPEWFTISRNGDSSLEHPPYVGYYQWLCPTRLGVREYLRGVVDRIASDSSVDGVHLDYIRHSDVILPVGLWEKYDLIQDREYPEFDFCYCDVCRTTFSRQTGNDPLALPDPTSDPGWREFRWNSVTELVQILAEAAHARGKPISAAVFPTPALARRLVRQAWDDWPLDAFFPMLYHTFYEQELGWIGASTAEGVAVLPSRTPLYSGLFIPSLPPADLADAFSVARAAGAAGVALFELGGLTDEHLERFAEAAR